MVNRRKVGMTSSPHGLYAQGYRRATMAGTMSCETVRWSETQGAGVSSDWRRQLDSMRSEALVVADQHAAVNTGPGLGHAARHTTGGDWSRSA